MLYLDAWFFTTTWLVQLDRSGCGKILSNIPEKLSPYFLVQISILPYICTERFIRPKYMSFHTKPSPCLFRLFF